MRTYSVVRVYEAGGGKVLRRGLTLAEAQAHCQRVETSSSSTPRRQTGGRWFDRYTEEPHRTYFGGVAERRVGLLESAIQEYCRVRK